MLLLHEMEEDGSTPDTAAFQAALDALRDAAQWEKAMELISEMDELGVSEWDIFSKRARQACDRQRGDEERRDKTRTDTFDVHLFILWC